VSLSAVISVILNTTDSVFLSIFILLQLVNYVLT